MKNINKFLYFIILSIYCCILFKFSSLAAYTENSGGVSEAYGRWTTDRYNTTIKQENGGTTIVVNGRIDRTSLEKGYHYYRNGSAGMFAVEKFVCEWPNMLCIHASSVNVDPFQQIHCGRALQSGWSAYCAYCGESNYYFFDATKTTISGIKKIQNNSIYFYQCPFCSGCNTQFRFTHNCASQISANKYKINYNANGGNSINGNSKSFCGFYMIDNKSVYNGSNITFSQNISINPFEREGYRFVGWSTSPNASIKDSSLWEEGESTLVHANQIAKDKNTNDCIIEVYAIWEELYTYVDIEPNGEEFKGETSKRYRVTKAPITINADDLIITHNSKVTFNTTGGILQNNYFNPVTVKKVFDYWNLSGYEDGSNVENNFEGEFYQSINKYYNKNITIMNYHDVFKAEYKNIAIVLPSATKTYTDSDGKKREQLFSGWFLNKECSADKYVGMSGDEYLCPYGENVTLYAKWSTLYLETQVPSVYNGTINGNWYWDVSINTPLAYKYQIKELGTTEYTDVKSATGTLLSEIPKTVTYNYLNQKQIYTVPSSGLYEITLSGASGGNFNTNKGGSPALQTFKVWLNAGEKLELYIGSNNGNCGGNLLYSGSKPTYDEASSNGGGATVIKLVGKNISSIDINGNSSNSINREFMLSVAAGGGGATINGNGFNADPDGISNLKNTNINTKTGNGGGGYEYDGKDGNVNVHYHDSNCWTLRDAGHSHNDSCYYYCSGDTSTGTLYHIGDASCGDGWCNYQCTACGDVVRRQVCPDRPGYSGAHCGNRKNSCGQDEREPSYYCIRNLNEGQVTSAEPGYGGKSYINSNQIMSYTLSLNQNYNGNGYVTIKPISYGYETSQSLSNIKAIDKSAPDKISVSKTVLDGKNYIVYIENPKDNGTKYVSKVLAYDVNNSNFNSSGNLATVRTESNEVTDEIISKLKGFVYYVDTKPNGDTITDLNNSKYSKKEANSTGSTSITKTNNGDIIIKEDVQYLHIAAYDNAGNISKTTDIKLPSKEKDPPPPVDPTITTEQILISGSNIYLKDLMSNSYYVKADNETPFYLSFSANMKRTVCSKDIQVNYMNFKISYQNGSYSYNSSAKITTCPSSTNNYASSLSSDSLSLNPYSIKKWSISNKFARVEIKDSFTLPKTASGNEMIFMPKAGSAYKDVLGDVVNGTEEVWSDDSVDNSNKIIIMPDGNAPTCTGLEYLQNNDYINFDEQSKIDVSIKFSDGQNGSGVKYSKVTICNNDNLNTRTYESNNGNPIDFSIVSTELLFIGDFSISVYMEDHVGNSITKTAGISGERTNGTFTRKLAPHLLQDTSDYKYKTEDNKLAVLSKGESGILNIYSQGYIDEFDIKIYNAADSLTNLVFSDSNKYYDLRPYEFKRNSNYYDYQNGDTNEVVAIFHYDENYAFENNANALEGSVNIDIDFMIPLYLNEGYYYFKIIPIKDNKEQEDLIFYIPFKVISQSVSDYTKYSLETTW